MKQGYRTAAIVICMLLLSACPQKELIFYEVPDEFAVGGASKDGSGYDIKTLMEFYGDAQQQSPAQRQKAIKRLKRSWQKSKQPGVGLHLVLLLIEGDQQEKLGAEKILDNLLDAGVGEEQEELANFVLLLRKQLTQQNSDLRLLQVRDQQLAEQNVQIKGLTEKINALKSIEKSIYEREYGSFAAQ